MMDTVLNIGLNDDGRRGLARAHRRRALRLRRLPAAGADVRHGGAGRARRAVRGGARRVARAARRRERRGPRRRGPRGRSPREFQAHRRASTSGRAFPDDPIEQLRLATEAVFRSWNGKRAQRLPQRRRHRARPRHRGEHRAPWCSATWAHGLGDRRRDHPQRDHRRARDRGRLPHQRAGRGRGRRHPRDAADRSSWRARCRRRSTELQRICHDAREATTATCRTSSSPSSAASCGCCRPATPSAPRRPRCASRSTWRRRSCITREEAVLRVSPEHVDFFLHPQFDPAATRTARGRAAP